MSADPSMIRHLPWVLCLLRGTLMLLLSLLSAAGASLFSALCNFVLLKSILQQEWYFVSYFLNVSSIPLPSSSLAGFSLIGSLLIDRKRGIFLPSWLYPSCILLVGFANVEVRSSFFSVGQRQHLSQSVCQGFVLEVIAMFRVEGLSFYHPV